MTLHIVVGPPAAGKSAYVEKHAKTGDVKVDFDRIAQAIGSPTPHYAEQPFRDLTYQAREAIIRRSMRKPHDDTWIIHTSPTAEQMDAYRSHDAKVHIVDPGPAAAHRQARLDKRPAATHDVIDAWYRNPPMHERRSTAAGALRAWSKTR